MVPLATYFNLATKLVKCNFASVLSVRGSTIVLLFFAAFAAGCVQAPAEGGEGARPDASIEALAETQGTAEDDNPEQMSVKAEYVEWWNGSVTTVGAGIGGSPACCASIRIDDETGEARFDAAGAKAILVELQWNDPVVDLDLVLSAPDYRGLGISGASISTPEGRVWRAESGSPGTPDLYAAILIDDPEVLDLEGEWEWTVDGKTSYATPFTVVVTVVFGGEPPNPLLAIG